MAKHIAHTPEPASWMAKEPKCDSPVSSENILVTCSCLELPPPVPEQDMAQEPAKSLQFVKFRGNGALGTMQEVVTWRLEGGERLAGLVRVPGVRKLRQKVE